MPASFNKDQLEKFSANVRPARGKHAIIITDARRHFKEDSDDVKVRLTWQILEKPENSNSVVKGTYFSTWWNTLLSNDDVLDHEAPQMAGQESCRLLSALYPDECPDWPRYNRDRGALMFRGTPITGDDEGACRNEAVLAAAQKTAELFGEEGEKLGNMVGERMFVEISYAPGNNFVRFKSMHSEMPSDWELSTVYTELDIADGHDVGAAPNEDQESAKVSKKRGKKKSKRK